MNLFHRDSVLNLSIGGVPKSLIDLSFKSCEFDGANLSLVLERKTDSDYMLDYLKITAINEENMTFEATNFDLKLEEKSVTFSIYR